MRIVIISDTHGLHHELHDLPQGDALLHAGDFTHLGMEEASEDFLNWFAGQPHEHKIFIGGNHDVLAWRQPEVFREMIPEGVTYLNDSGTKIGSYSVWGSPVQPDLLGMAFGKRRGVDMREHWDQIPEETDILITHTPPMGILDRSNSGKNLGCEQLSNYITNIKPSLHVFGHIHAGYGKIDEHESGTIFVNGSNIKTREGLVNPPIIVELEAQSF